VKTKKIQSPSCRVKVCSVCLYRSGVRDDLWISQPHSGGLPGEPDVSAALLPRHTRHGARPPGRLQGSAPLVRGGRRPQRYGEAVLGSRDILVRIRIRTSVLTAPYVNPGGPKTYGSYGCGAGTLLISHKEVTKQ
jgi:hypothetical protein